MLAIAPSILGRLDDAEREKVASMVGEVFDVYEIDEWGGAWVEKWWHQDDAHATSHSISLKPDQMEVAIDAA